MTLRKALMAAALVAAPLAVAGTAQAQRLEGVYIGAGGGINWVTDSSLQAPFTGSVSTDVGFVGLGSVGYAFGNGLRLELEGNYRYNTASAPGGRGGNLQSYGPMVNAFYDFDAGWGSVTPYVGFGIGYLWGTLDGVGTSNSSKGAWAGQGILGAAFDVGVPGLAVTAEARVLGTLESVRYSGGNRSATTDNQVNLSGLMGIRYTFGQEPPPAPAPVPAPAPARTYLVFFDWDKDVLTARAKQIIADAAAASTKVAVTRIDVGGHADNTGTPQYNMGLSLRRANNVAAELVRLGVPKNIIDIKAYGDTRPLVPTGPQTREPQNRRVEIVLK
jgi:OOP family OmpA-OmpF porin